MNTKATKELTMFGHAFWLIYKFIAAILVWGLISWVIFLFAMCCVEFFVGNQFGVRQVQHLLIGQLNYLSRFDSKTHIVLSFSQMIYQLLFVKTHMVSFFQNAQVALRSYFYIFSEVTMLFVVKLAIVFFAIPVFLMFGLIGLVEGLVQRDLRKFGGGRESSLKYHSAKRLVYPIVILGYVVYLLMPFNLMPEFIFLPFAVLFGFFVSITIKSFKKYV